MKKCPFCGTEIEDSAQFCLYCMKPLGEKEQIQLRKKKKPQWLLIIAAIVVAFLILMIVLFGKQNTPNSEIPSGSQNNNTAPSSIETEATTSTHDQIATQIATQPPTEPTQTTTQIIIQSDTTSHVHNYILKTATKDYLKTPATCTELATYYYSCYCGKKGSETFQSGSTKSHTKVTIPGYPATCVSAGLTDKVYCSVCGCTVTPAMEIKAKGHVFTLGDSSSGCLDCGAKETATINCPDFPVIVDNTYRVNSGTYRIVPAFTDTWMITFTFDYTNISSERTYLCPDVHLWGVTGTGTEHGSLAPNASGTFKAQAQIKNPNGPYTLAID